MAYQMLGCDSPQEKFLEANYMALEDGEEPNGYGHNNESFEDYYGDVPRRMLYINGYERGQGYGGSEEGGWWFDTGEPVASVPVSNLADAITELQRMDRLMHDMFADERPYYSAAGGADGLVMVQPRFAESFPTERPRYE